MKLSYRLCLILLALSFTVSACIPSYYTVFITPPNYGIVINLDDASSQATTNDLNNGTLMTVAQQKVTMKRCVVAIGNQNNCPDVMVVEVPGAFVTRNYTAEANSGTSENSQSLCFEANGANGCVDFTITAQVLRENAKCYANKVGIAPVGSGDEARFHFAAKSLDGDDGVLDSRVIGVTSGVFSQKVATMSPLTMALEKYGLFEEVKPQIIQTIFDQTCVTIKPEDMYISNGIVWSDPTIQDQINQATVLANQLELLAMKNDLMKQQTQALLDRAKLVEEEYGLAAAIEFMRIQTEQMKIEKWDGTSWLPFVNPTSGDMIPATPVIPEAPVTP